jgi:hypothetical protein
MKIIPPEQESAYYGSPLNKFIAKNCKRNMTVMNIDLITYDKNKKHIRIIESKHMHERIGIGQGRLLKLLRTLFKTITSYKVDVFIIRGNPPYDMVYLEDVISGKRKLINKEQLIDFLNYNGLSNK